MLNEEDFYNSECEKAQKGIYDSSFLLKAIKPFIEDLSLLLDLRIYLKKDFPLRVDLNIKGNVSIKYWLAPRIEDLEEEGF
jgi:hypothetical protein